MSTVAEFFAVRAEGGSTYALDMARANVVEAARLRTHSPAAWVRPNVLLRLAEAGSYRREAARLRTLETYGIRVSWRDVDWFVDNDQRRGFAHDYDKR